MRSIVSRAALVVLACTALPHQARAQEEDGVGGVIDWIIRLSGPGLVGPAISYFHQFEAGVRVRFSLAYRVSENSDDAIEPDGSSINALTLRPDLEVPIRGPLEVGAGVSVNRFGGDIDQGFWHASIPVFLQVRAPFDAAGPWRARAGLGLEYFMEFDAADFDPLTVDVSTSGGEWAPIAFIGVDYVFPG
ncbi:MAG TPA: hypothetical protein VK849_02660, partial [Longimicrobiales bacterium]|nr:hypothetical protein [Longimicrobiales bacterium]